MKTSQSSPLVDFFQAEAQKDALRRDPDYEKYIENLRSANYFRGEIQGSQLWSDLESKAASTYVEIRRAEYVLCLLALFMTDVVPVMRPDPLSHISSMQPCLEFKIYPNARTLKKITMTG